jgi:hypothetical protein
MRNLLWLSIILSGLLITNLSAASIQYTVTPLGGSQYQYTYTITGSFNQYEAIDIQFDGTVVTAMSNSPVANPATDWSVQAFAPLPGFGNGDYLLEAMVSNPSLSGPFSEVFTYSGPSQPGPGDQLFSLEQFNSDGNFQGYYDSSNNLVGSPYLQSTSLLQDVQEVPEPAGAPLAALGVLLACAAVAARRRAAPGATV